ncbi:MAG TPA: tetratricopeptide repeat protein [Gemmatimonadales bacterium]|nr:tetratricopeptide repeat protein [Gemmatimonadales bacterium]
MAAPSEIEKLERRYAENPDGRFFAPLADAYRKAGRVDEALDLVRAGLAKHPDYLSAYIVLGRCLLDKNDHAEAEKTFRSVLDLDAENIIALKSLAEITERTGRPMEARMWLQKLLAVDSMNTEAEADLQRLGGPIAEQVTQPIEPVRSEGGGVSFADLAAEVEPAAVLAASLPPAPGAALAAVQPPAAEPPPPPPPPAPPAPEAPEAALPAAIEAHQEAPPASAPAEAPPAPAVAEALPPPAPPPPPPVAAVPPEPAPAAPMAAVEPPPPPLPVAEVPAAPVAEVLPAPALEAAPAAGHAEEPPLTLLEPAPEVGEVAPAPGLVPVIDESAVPPAEAVPDRHPLPQELQVGDSGLDLMPFDDSLAWGTGERSSRAIRAEDVAGFEHDDALTSPAAEFLAGLEGAGAPGEPLPSEEIPPSGRVEGGEYTIEHEDHLQLLDSPSAEEPPVNIELPANLSGAYSIVDMPEPGAPPPPAAEPPAPRPSAGLPLIMPEDVTPAEELKRPSSKLVQMVSPPPTEERGGVAEEAMASETLGDLYLQQGFRTEAAAVYRKLLAQRPGDAGLLAKLKAIEAPPSLSADSQGAESVGTWLKRVAASRLRSPSAPAPEPGPSAGPSPLEAAFAAGAPEPTGEPAHPAHEAFSLDQIFGGGEGQAAPAAGAAPAPAPPAQVGGTSFDEFFGAPPDKTSVRPATKAPDEPAHSEEEDLTAFNAWLQGLKR